MPKVVAAADCVVSVPVRAPAGLVIKALFPAEPAALTAKLEIAPPVAS
jgi:hypothetical protein